MFCRIVFCDKSKGLKKKKDKKKTKNNCYFHLSVQHPIYSRGFSYEHILHSVARKSRVCEIFFGLHSSINCHLKVGLPNPTEKRQWTILSRRWQFIQENSNGNLSSFAQVKDFL